MELIPMSEWAKVNQIFFIRKCTSSCSELLNFLIISQRMTERVPTESEQSI
jgi:hypothetical protein